MTAGVDAATSAVCAPTTWPVNVGGTDVATAAAGAVAVLATEPVDSTLAAAAPTPTLNEVEVDEEDDAVVLVELDSEVELPLLRLTTRQRRSLMMTTPSLAAWALDVRCFDLDLLDSRDLDLRDRSPDLDRDDRDSSFFALVLRTAAPEPQSSDPLDRRPSADAAAGKVSNMPHADDELCVAPSWTSAAEPAVEVPCSATRTAEGERSSADSNRPL